MGKREKDLVYQRLVELTRKEDSTKYFSSRRVLFYIAKKLKIKPNLRELLDLHDLQVSRRVDSYLENLVAEGKATRVVIEDQIEREESAYEQAHYRAVIK